MSFRSPSKQSALIASLGLLIFHPSARAVEQVTVNEAPVAVHNIDISLSTNASAPQGGFDAFGNYIPYPDGSTVWSLSNNFTVSYRFTQALEADASFSVKQTDETFPSGSVSSTSFGSLLFGGRYHLGGWAHAIIHGGFGLPYRVASTSTQGNPTANLQSDTGDGTIPSTSAHLGFGVSRSFHRFRAAFDVTAIYPFATDQTQNDVVTSGPPTVLSVQGGKRVGLTEGVAYFLSDQWNLTAGLGESWSQATTANGIPEVNAASRGTSSNIGGSYIPNRTWRWTVTYNTQFPFYAYDVNTPYSPSLGIVMTYSGI
jgi:hypothetical protein